MRVLWISSLAMGLASILVGLAFNGVASALDAWWALASIFSGGILGLFLLGLIVQNTSSKQAAIAVLAGVVVIIWMSLSALIFTGELEPFQNPLHSNMTIVMGTVTIFILGFVLGAIGNKKKS